MNALATTVAALAGKELFKKVVQGVYEYCVAETGRTLKQWTTERQIDSLYRRIGQVRKVKTIWQIDKAVDLMDFYCDSHVLIGKKRKKIATLSDFGIDENILIQGIAGQGKSILLRYICANELARGQRIPLFLELRRISHEFSLMDRIRNAFLALGLSVDEQLFRGLASSGKLLLLLDAFDEVPDELKSKVLTDIEDLSAAHENLRIVVTSRPYHNIQVSNHFTVVTLDNLHGNEYAQVIHKLASGQAWAKGLVEHIGKRATHIKDLLCTPLMVTLLVLSYKSYQKLPAKLSEFYDALFQTLLQRHDGTKPGFTRRRGCALDDNEYRQTFECLCILSKKKGQQSLTSEMIYNLSKESIALCGFHENATAFVDDIVKITCLIIRDGDEHRFIHKTVQEYYTASYIQKKPDSWVTHFYERVLNGNAEREWEQELEFLSEIDTYRYNRNYLLPSLLQFLGIAVEDLEHDPKPVSLDHLASLLDSFIIRFRKSGYSLTGVQLSFRDLSYLHTSFFRRVCFRKVFLNKEIAVVCEKVGLSEDVVTHMFKELSDCRTFTAAGRNSVSIGTAMRKGLLPAIAEAAQVEYLNLFERAKTLKLELIKEESPSLLDGLV